MRDALNLIWTPQFFAGTLVAGLLLNVLGAYVVRAIDRLRVRLPGHFRRIREAESLRIQRLSDEATADTALYAALAAEAGRFRVHQLLGLLTAFASAFALLFLMAIMVGSEAPPVDRSTGERVQAMILITFLVLMGGFHYASSLEHGRLARRLDIALRGVQRNRTLPIMD